jgi:hypothetical protein
VDQSATGLFELHYPFQDSLRGVEVLVCNDRRSVRAVWKSGNDLRVLTGIRDGHGGPFVSGYSSGRYEWRAFRQGRLEGNVPQPDACPVLGDPNGLPLEPARSSYDRREENPWDWRARAGQDTIFAVSNGDHKGLWRCRGGTEPNLICADPFSQPVVTPDGKLAVARNGEGDIVVVELATGKQSRLDFVMTKGGEVLCYLPAHKKMLISRDTGFMGKSRRTRVSGGWADVPIPVYEYRLLDPATGKTEVMEGEFAPLCQLTYRPLQPTGNPDEAWAAIPSEDGNATRIGRYDMKQFKFAPILALPGAIFTSMDMWVDEAEGAAYVVLNEDLLRIPLPARRSDSRPAAATSKPAANGD